ncbi:MAG TPA: extracellular solute-binding protein [Micromonosporaceae bacterium]
MAGRKGIAALGVVAVSLMLAAACSSNSGNSGQITLKVRLFGTFGYKEAGLFDKYEQEHPNIKIDYQTVEQEATYWTGLQASLAGGSGLGDVQGIEVGRITAVTSQLADKFVDLNTYGASSLKDNFYPWKWGAGSTSDGKVIGLGTDIGPLAICYRADLFKAAGLPTDPSAVSDLWKDGWDGYIAAGEQYKSKAPAGSYFVDTAGGIFNAIIGQSQNQYYDASGNLIVSTNPAVKTAWDQSVELASKGLTAKLSQFSTAWNIAFTTGTFATIACPSWMVGYIKSEAGAMSKDFWNIASIPGGGGNWGGSYLSIPKGAAHPKEAYDLISWLTAAEQEAAIFKAVGNFPSNSKAAADPTVASATDAYFSGGTGQPAPIGQIFADSASKLVVAVTGLHDGDIKNAISTAITRVETGDQTSDQSWNQLLSKDIPAITG